MKKKRIFILIGSIIIALLILITTGIIKVPLEKICKLRGGEWNSSFLMPDRGYCNFSTSDAGKECTSGSECEGDCLAELTKSEKEKLGPFHSGTLSGLVGKCSEWKLNSGCVEKVENGELDQTCKDF